MASLKDVVIAEKAKDTKEKKGVVSKMKADVKTPKKNWSDFEHNMMVSLYVDIDNYLRFKRINKKLNISTNGSLNAYIGEQVLKFSSSLTEEELQDIEEEKAKILDKAREKAKKKAAEEADKQ